MISNLCEWCNERYGQRNSQYWIDEDYDAGHWVCMVCEEEISKIRHNTCPCGCDNPGNCVYRCIRVPSIKDGEQ